MTKEASQLFDTVVLGGGIAGLIAGLLAQEQNPRGSVLLIEGARHLGGAMAGCRAMGDEFDLGTHIPQETGVSRIDRLFHRAVRVDGLQILPSQVGDRAGTTMHGEVFTDTSYPDLLRCDPFLAENIVAHVLESIQTNPSAPERAIRSATVKSVATEWYGHKATALWILPMLQHRFGDTAALSGFALELCNFTRLRAATETTWLRYSDSAWFRQRIAFPQQQQLPVRYKHQRFSMYPNRGSSATFIRGFEKLSREKQIQITLNTRVKRVDTDKKSIEISSGQRSTYVRFRRLISTLGPTSTLPLLQGLQPPPIERVNSRIVHHLLDKPLKSDLCYMYVLSHDSAVFRITNYGAFSNRKDDVRLTSELIAPTIQSDAEAIRDAELTLHRCGLLKGQSVVQSSVVHAGGGFVNPTVETFNKFAVAARELHTFEDENFIVSGTGALGEACFQNEILLHLNSRII